MSAPPSAGAVDIAEQDGWKVRRYGPPEAEVAALLLPGLMCTASFYDDVLADPRIDEGPLAWFAATPPGFGGRSLPEGFVPSVEGYARLTAGLAARLECGIVVGHSYFANVAVEMVATGRFAGRLVLLSPCFSASDEERDLRTFDRIGRVPCVGAALWSLMPRMLPSGMAKRFPPARQAHLVAEMQQIDPAVTRALVRRYFDHLRGSGSIAARVCDAGTRAWVLRGSGDEVAMPDETRRRLEACPTVTLTIVQGAGHFVMTDRPHAVVDAVLDAAHSLSTG